jgi:hypothetical protein
MKFPIEQMYLVKSSRIFPVIIHETLLGLASGLDIFNDRLGSRGRSAGSPYCPLHGAFRRAYYLEVLYIATAATNAIHFGTNTYENGGV